jgi:predicted ester cyclase
MARYLWLISLIFIGFDAGGCRRDAATSERNVPVTQPTQTLNKDIVRQLFEEGLNRAQETVIERLVGAEYVDATGERGPNAFKQVMTRLHTAFPDLTYVIDDILGEGDRVAVRWHWTGTHRGPFRNIAPTERSLTNTGSAIFRVRDGKVVGAALETDRLGFLQSIGVVPPNEVLFKPSAPLAATAPAAAK